jgi:hypothetical protein
MTKKQKQSQGKVSKTLQKSQSIHLYSPVTWTKNQHCSALETKLMNDTFLNDKRGDQCTNTSVYERAIDAENDAFLFHYSSESTMAKKQLDNYKGNPKSILEATTDSTSTILIRIQHNQAD